MLADLGEWPLSARASLKRYATRAQPGAEDNRRRRRRGASVRRQIMDLPLTVRGLEWVGEAASKRSATCAARWPSKRSAKP